ncbi:MAG: [protein-PII] uridylyltransferase [Verrucomicrobiota bacterium]
MASSHWEKVLSHAERQLENESLRKPRDLLDVYRKFLKIEEHRLKLNHLSGGGGREIAQKRSYLLSLVLKHVWRGAIENALRAHFHKEPPVALIAVGGFGRGELNPYSDIDLLFLYEKGGESSALVKDTVEEVLYMLWDVGFDVGHATRSQDEVIEQVRDDFQTRTAMLESRFLCGNVKLWEKFQATFEKKCIEDKIDEYVEWRLEDQRQRHLKHNNTPFVQEPNIKGGCGGLRDYQSLLWLARVKRKIHSTQELVEQKFITPSERKAMDSAYDFILRLRTELHFQQKRKGDVLTLQLQGKIANAFEYPQKTILRRIESLMRDYYQHAQVLYQLTNHLSERLAGVKSTRKSSPWNLIPKSLRGAKNIDGFVIQEGVIEASDSSIFAEDRLRVLRVFVHAQNHKCDLGSEIRFKLRRRLKLVDRSFIYHQSTREMLLGIFSKKGQVGRILRMMHEVGLLGRFFPEFEPLTCLVQHEFFHRYTADEHTLVCLEMLDGVIDAKEAPFLPYKPLMERVDKSYLLYLAMLLHDTGKSEGGRHHADQSALNAMKVCRRFKLKSTDLSTLIFLTDHHMTMSDVARTKNLDEHETILEFARIVQTPERLDMLMLITFADGMGTGGDKKWLDWREMLLWRLYHLTRQALAGEEEFLLEAKKSIIELKEQVKEKRPKSITLEEVEAHFSCLPERYFNTLSEPLIVHHLTLIHEFLNRLSDPEFALSPVVGWIDHPDQSHTEVTVVTWDRELVFAKIAGVLALSGFSILSAEIFTRADNIVVDTFRISNEMSQAVTHPKDQKKVRDMMEKVFSNPDFDLNTIIPLKKGVTRLGLEGLEFPTKITFDTRSSLASTLLNITTPDRPGLLYLITRCLSECKTNIVFARVTTEKGAALDSFYLTDRENQKIIDPVWLDHMTQELRKTLEVT